MNWVHSGKSLTLPLSVSALPLSRRIVLFVCRSHTHLAFLLFYFFFGGGGDFFYRKAPARAEARVHAFETLLTAKLTHPPHFTPHVTFVSHSNRFCCIECIPKKK
eukprot:RCo008407